MSFSNSNHFFVEKIIFLKELKDVILLKTKNVISFSENIFQYFEDVDFIRFAEINHKNVCVPEKQNISIKSEEKKHGKSIINEFMDEKRDPQSGLPVCFDCNRTIFDPNKLCRWNNHFYCRDCRNNILAQIKGDPEE
jgi:hypothetical protein